MEKQIILDKLDTIIEDINMAVDGSWDFMSCDKATYDTIYNMEDVQKYLQTLKVEGVKKQLSYIQLTIDSMNELINGDWVPTEHDNDGWWDIESLIIEIKRFLLQQDKEVA